MSETCVPLICTDPELGVSRPAITFRSVLFPEPDRPLKATKLLRATVNDTSSNAVTVSTEETYWRFRPVQINPGT
ncbi:conserved protein of unknown function [Micropruina glycogenica]|uniref:Uncharacterized protein n=1 Tax=Micropruina glycogenica TaxID=75385 RepID=A0A2N9JJS7_9ACTN|nr:conserved protein of unknown function [Micropruina glycogenica]